VQHYISQTLLHLLSMKHVFLPAIMLLVVLTSACRKKEEAPAAAIDADFELLNTQGQPAVSFRQGQNILFRFRLKNNTSQNALLTNPLFETDHFLEVSRVNTAISRTVVGKPYKYIFCAYVGGYPVRAHDRLVITIPWVADAAYPMSDVFCAHAANSYLPTGHYSCSFTTALRFDPNGSITNPAVVLEPQTFTKEFDVL